MAESTADVVELQGKGKRRSRKLGPRPLKWQQIFQLLRDSADRMALGNRPAAIELAGKAADWAGKWTSNYREETSMGATVRACIEANVVRVLSRGAGSPKGIMNTVDTLERIVAREAKVSAVHVAQHHLRLHFNGKTPDEARERAVAAALRQVRQALVEGAD